MSCVNSEQQVEDSVSEPIVKTKEQFNKRQTGPFECVECGREFTHRGNLMWHLQAHSGQKSYKCEHCDKAFSQCGNLNRHLRTHTGTKPYKCRQCDRAFSDPSNRRVHELNHTDELPHKCTWCGKTFVLRDYLRTHERIHTGVKPCGQCGKARAASGDLCKHEKTQHPVAETPKKAQQRASSIAAGPSSGFVAVASSTAQATHCPSAFARSIVTMNPMSAGLMSAMVYSYAPHGIMCAQRMNSPQISSPSALTTHLRPYGDYADAAAAQQQHKPPSSRKERVRMVAKRTVRTSQNATSSHPIGCLVPGPSANGFPAKRTAALLASARPGRRTRAEPKGVDLIVIGEDGADPAACAATPNVSVPEVALGHGSDDPPVKAALFRKKPLECIVCHQILPGKCALQAHYKIHPVAERPYKCKICGRALSSEVSLKEHMFMHNLPPPFRNHSSTAGTRKTHMRVDRAQNAVHDTARQGLLEKSQAVQPAFLPASSAGPSVSSPFQSPSWLPITSLADLPGTALLYPRELLKFPSRLAVPTTSSFGQRPYSKPNDRAVDAANVPVAIRKDSVREQRAFNHAADAEPVTEDTPNDVEHRQTEASSKQPRPSVQPTEKAQLEAQASLAEPPPTEADLLRSPKRELDEYVDVELLDEPPVPVREHRSSCASSTANTPSLPTLVPSSSLTNTSGPVAYFGDAVYERINDPSSFTYESDVYGRFNFVLLDEIEKEEGGQLSVVRLYQCDACLGLSQTHKYKDEVVHTIMTSGHRIVKYDPATPRGILHLCVRHRRSIIKNPVG